MFCDETVVALQTRTSINSANTSGMVYFIEMFLQFWKIVNVKGLGSNLRFKDPKRDVVKSAVDNQLKFWSNLAVKEQNMESNKRNRKKVD